MSKEIPEKVLNLLEQAAQELISEDEHNGMESAFVFAYMFRDLDGDDWFGSLQHGGVTQAIGLHHRSLQILYREDEDVD